MNKPMIQIHNVETGEITERQMNDTEYEQHLKDVEDSLARKAEAQAKAAQRQAILDRLGLSAEEANLLLGGN